VPQTARDDYGATQVPEVRTTGNFPVALILGGKGLGGAGGLPDALEFAASEAASPTIDQSIKVGDITHSQGVAVGHNISNTTFINSPGQKR
jgi:hypothetical protein